MRAFEVHINGKKLWTAGIGDWGVLTAIVTSHWDWRDPSGQEKVELNLAGLMTRTGEHLDWKTPRLRTGDEIRIRLVDTDTIDPPTKRRKEPTASTKSSCSTRSRRSI